MKTHAKVPHPLRTLAAALVTAAALFASPPAAALAPITNLSQLAAGEQFTCALTTTGGVKCWGENNSGEVGDGSGTMRTIPTDVTGLASGVAGIVAGLNHACALTTGGGVKCWGRNDGGQLGDGTTTNRPAPVDVTGLASGVAAIAAGRYHSCAVTTGGGVKCWGFNANGQLGDGSTAQSLAPVDVSGLATGVAAIDAGNLHTCALTTAGGLKCWGANGSGRLGDGTTTERHAPADVAGLASGVAAVVAGESHTCALTTGGGLKCWGYSGNGRIGDYSFTDQHAPADVMGLGSGVTAVAAGLGHTCAITTGGAMKCWGYNGLGQVGDGVAGDRFLPTDVSGLASGVTAIATGDFHTCAVMAGGGAKCWGGNSFGQLGHGASAGRHEPVDVTGLAGGATFLAAGGQHTCAVASGGGARCWGYNAIGQLGDDTSINRLAPVDVSGLASGVAALAAGENHTCALTTGGAAMCWGYNGDGQLGDDSTTLRLAPVGVSGLASGVAALAAGDNHTCALTTGGGVKCWGRNNLGQLGDDSTTGRLAPVDVTGLGSGVAAIAAGASFTCALTTAGAMKCWGGNGSGQLGDGTTTSRGTPGDVSGLATDVSAIAAGANHACAVMAGGGAKCWGLNSNGQLGVGLYTVHHTPADVSGLASGVARLGGGNIHTCALTTGGGVKCWGASLVGQVGDGTTETRLAPVDVTGLASGATALDVGANHACVLATGGGVKCWGANQYGALGDGTAGIRPLPVDVLDLDREPDPFGFASQDAVPAGSLRTSGTIVPAGYEASAAISVANGEYGIGCAGFTAVAASIAPGQSVCVRHTASASPGASVVTTLTIGGVAGTFTSTTELASQAITFDPIADRVLADGAFAVSPTATSGLAVSLATATPATCSVSGFLVTPLADGLCTLDADQAGDATFAPAPTVTRSFSVLGDTVPDGFAFAGAPGVSPGAIVTSEAIVVAGMNAPAAIAVTDGSYAIGCAGAFTTAAGSIAPGQSVCVRHAAATAFATPTTTTLTIGGIAGAFTSTTMAEPVLPPARGDANGDRKADLFWTDGPAVSWWLMDGATLQNATYFEAPAGWSVKDVGDIDGDGRADLLWRRDADGATYAWLVSGTGFAGFVDLGVVPTDYALVGAADLDGDGQADLVWRSAAGLVYGWLMDAGAVSSQGAIAHPDVAWTLVDMADMNGDGRADLVYRHATTGEVWVMAMNGLAIASQASAGTLDSAGWHLLAAADFDGDGRADLLWRSAAGDTWVWKMDGATFVAAGGLGDPGAAWSVRAIGDFDGNGKADLVWRHADGTTYLWLMDGLAVASYLPVANPGGAWEIVAP